jgi:hypothetical protein
MLILWINPRLMNTSGKNWSASTSHYIFFGVFWSVLPRRAASFSWLRLKSVRLEILGSIQMKLSKTEELDIDFWRRSVLSSMCENGRTRPGWRCSSLQSAQVATVAALATLCCAGGYDQTNAGRQSEPLLVPCKAQDSRGPPRALLQDDLLGRAASEDELNK